MEAFVDSKHESGISVITFYHPQSNSLPSAILRKLATAIVEAGQNTTTQVIVVQSLGDKTFCAGASFDELVAITTTEEGLHFFSGFALVINAIRTCPKLVVGRIQGKCVGGGVGIAAACDYAIATHEAQVKLSELAVGIGPFVVGPAVERKIGTSAFSQLAINATQWESAQWALEKGLFYELAENTTELDKKVNQLTQTLAQSSPEAMYDLKKVMWEGTAHWGTLLIERAAISGRLVLSDFTRKAIEQFKRK